MKFDRLRLSGFKSFVEPTEFVIENGLTGVVGPNGCGKSNLVEALRWVMGENSYKNMRASGMDDVIFSGSGNRPARNTAEVSLFLDNSDHTAPAQFNEDEQLQVSRRIERESGSVYRINGKEVRAKDVQLLFADASTGARSPSMVGQGRIGELISAKPQARRALLEEAAGISGLHSRRHEAELRLRAAEQNLERLDDVIAEIESQLDSLKRQARQANRYRNISGDIRKTEALMFHLRWAAAKTSEAENESALSAATALLAGAAEAQAKTARDEAVAAAALPELRDAEAAAGATLQSLKFASNQLEEELARLQGRKAELQGRLEQLAADIEREKTLAEENQQALTALHEEQARLEAESLEVGNVETASREALEQATRKLGEREAELSELTIALADRNARKEQLEKSLQEAAARKQRLETQLSQSTGELTALTAEIEAMTGPADSRAEVERMSGELEASEAAFQSAEAATAERREEEQAARLPLDEAEANLRELETEARTLAQVLNRAGTDLFPAVVEAIKVEPGFEAALGAALGEDLDAPLEASAAVHWAGCEVSGDDPALPDGAKPLADVVEAPRELARRLAQIGIVDKAQAAAMAKMLKPGQRLVSIDGDLWRWDGLVAGAEAPTAAAQRLAQKNRLTELEGRIAETRSDVEKASDAYDAAREATAQAIEQELTARENLKNVRQKLSGAQEALLAAERTVGQQATRRSTLEEVIARIRIDLEETADTSATMAREMAEAEVPAEDLSRVETLKTKVAEDRTELAEARAQFQNLSREAEARGRRLETIKGEIETWKKRLANAQKQAAALGNRQQETEAELAKLEEAPEEFEQRRRELMNRLEAAEGERNRAADALQVAISAHADVDRLAKQAVEELSAAREKSGRTEERLAASKERRGEIEGRIREELDCAPSELFVLAEIKDEANLPDAEKVETKLERLKAERERLGAVNLRAEAEQAEIEEKRVGLVSERDDLIAAIAKLRSGIQSLNKEGRERLLEAFEVVNSQFQRLFTHLFGGGTAELQLVESDDPLEAGLEILARPPGKKPQTMTLLSGGEQALTALALIFAVFLTNPAPICVLDEVDAPLDDHNVERFCNLMDEMVANTQTKFVLITHNPITMSRVNRLFGVTMAERGVSQLVSVDLEEAHSYREAG